MSFVVYSEMPVKKSKSRKQKNPKNKEVTEEEKIIEEIN